MPGHYNMPVIPNRYPLDKNDKLGLAIGALLSGGLAAANSNRNMGENPLLRGIAGGVAGFGGGANQIQDSYSKMFDDYLKGEGMDFRNRDFGQKVKEYEESEKPEKLARARWYDEREAKTPEWLQKIQYRESSPENADAYARAFPEKVSTKEPDYLSKMASIDTKIANLELKDLGQTNPRIQASINSLRNTKAQYHNKLYGSGTSVKDLGFDFNAPTPKTISKSLDEKAAMQFLNQANGDKNKARELARQAGYEF